MNEVPFHPQKPTLIEHVSDDIRDLRKTNGEQQKVLFSGRALADLLAGDDLLDANQSDTGYFELTGSGARKLNLDKVVDSCIRHVLAESYIESSAPIGITGSGFLHVAAILPSGVLTYISSEGDDVPKAIREYATMKVRQIFYPDDLREFEAYTRVGKCETKDGKKVWTWSSWVTLSGRPLRVLVNDTNKTQVLGDNLRAGVIYELHCAGGNIILPDADKLTAGSEIVFEQYSNKEAKFVDSGVNTKAVPLPVPSDKIRYFIKEGSKYIPAGTNKGWLTEFDPNVDKYYVQDSTVSAWMSTAQYSERVETDGSQTEKRTYSMQMIPSLDTIRTSEGGIDGDSGLWYENSEGTIQYRFEVVDREKPVIYFEDGIEHISTLTWMLDMDPEAVTKMSDMAELLDAHTDPMLKDIVMYGQRQFSGPGGNVPSGHDDFSAYIPTNTGTLVVSRPATMCGYVKFSIIGNTSATGGKWYNQLTKNFKVAIYKYNDGDEGFRTRTYFDYKPVQTTGIEPNQYQQYYIQNPSDGTYRLAGNYGYLEHFAEGASYFIRTPKLDTDGIQPVKFRHVFDKEQAEHEAVFLANDSSEFARGAFWDAHSTFTGYVHADRNDTIMVVITAGGMADTSKGHVQDAALVSPVVEFYPDAHETYVMKPNVVPQEVFSFSRLNKFSCPGTKEETIASATALAKAYETIVSQLQNKGLMFGSLVPTKNDLDQITSTGILTLKNAMTHGPSGAVTSNANATLIVFDSVAYQKELLLPPGEADSGASRKDNKNNPRTTQIFIGNDGVENNAKMWIRYKSSDTWTKWVPIQPAQTIIPTYSTDVSAEQVTEALTYGNPVIVVDGGTAHTTRTVTLPDPANYKGTKLQVEAVRCLVNITYSGNTYTSAMMKDDPDRMIYPLECDGTNWFVITVV